MPEEPAHDAWREHRFELVVCDLLVEELGRSSSVRSSSAESAFPVSVRSSLCAPNEASDIPIPTRPGLTTDPGGYYLAVLASESRATHRSAVPVPGVARSWLGSGFDKRSPKAVIDTMLTIRNKEGRRPHTSLIPRSGFAQGRHPPWELPGDKLPAWLGDVMSALGSTKKKVAAVVTGGAVLLGGGAAGVLALGGTSSAAPLAAAAPATLASATTGAKHAGHHAGVHCRHPRSLLQRADYATAEVKVKGRWVTMTMDKGRVSAVSPTSMTLARPDGKSVTVALGAGTHYRGAASSEAALKTGQTASVTSQGGTARVVVAHNPKAKRAHKVSRSKGSTAPSAAG